MHFNSFWVNLPYFRALTTASIFKGFQNYLSCLRKQAGIQISDQKEGMMAVAELCGAYIKYINNAHT